jgi:hypothetical protein
MPREFFVRIPHPAPRHYGSIDEVWRHAARHAQNRLLHACEMITWISGFAGRWKKSYSPAISVRGNPPQDGSAGEGWEAAHLLPGLILIDDKPVWAFAATDATEIALKARFTVTALVEVSFNRADSAVESSGLRAGFRQACGQAWLRATPDASALIPIFGAFIKDADAAVLRAKLAKEVKRNEAKTESASLDRWLEMSALECYRSHGLTAEEVARRVPAMLALSGLLHRA